MWKMQLLCMHHTRFQDNWGPNRVARLVSKSVLRQGFVVFSAQKKGVMILFWKCKRALRIPKFLMRQLAGYVSSKQNERMLTAPTRSICLDNPGNAWVMVKSQWRNSAKRRKSWRNSTVLFPYAGRKVVHTPVPDVILRFF
jgi:hypothetical protein